MTWNYYNVFRLKVYTKIDIESDQVNLIIHVFLRWKIYSFFPSTPDDMKGLKAFLFLILLYLLRYIVFILCIHCSNNKNKMSCVFIKFYMLLLLIQKSQKLLCALPTYLYIIFTSYKYWKSTPQTHWCLKFNFVLVLKDKLVY